MKRILTSFNKRGSSQETPSQSTSRGEIPESAIVKEIVGEKTSVEAALANHACQTAFCESSAPNSPSAGDEFLHLPAIVEAAESNPSTAREAALSIRRYLSKGYNTRAYAQYNAIMLIRILTDNPGPTFSRNFDTAFVKTVKELLREGQDLSVQQMLRETLDSLETKQKNDATLNLLIEMWRKEKAKSNTKSYGNSTGPRMSQGPHVGASQPAQPGNHFARHHKQPNSLPPPDELAARIEEAKTTAKLLSQTVQSTPVTGVPNNDLIKEFADRAASASRSIQGYIHSNNPAPDEDTLLTLIETNDHLSIAMSKHQRALLQARRAMNNSPPTTSAPTPDQINYTAPQGPPPGVTGAARKQSHDLSPPTSPPQRAQHHTYAPQTQPTPPNGPSDPVPQGYQSPHQRQQSSQYDTPENPFADEPRSRPVQQQSYGLFPQSAQAPSPVGSEQQPQQQRAPQQSLPQPESFSAKGQNPSHSYQSTPNSAYQHEPTFR